MQRASRGRGRQVGAQAQAQAQDRRASLPLLPGATVVLSSEREAAGATHQPAVRAV